MNTSILILVILISTLFNSSFVLGWSTSAKLTLFNPLYRDSTASGRQWMKDELISFSEFVSSKPLLSHIEEQQLGRAVKLGSHLEKMITAIYKNDNITTIHHENDNNTIANNFDNDYMNGDIIYFSRLLGNDKMIIDKLASQLECSPETIQSLAMSADKAYEKLVSNNLRLVLAIVSRYAKSNLPITELIAEGTRGLSKAVRRFDYEKGFRFATYATWYISQGVSDYVRWKSNPTKVPSKYLILRRNLKKFMPVYQQEHRRNPTLQEICEALGTCEVDVVKCLGIQNSAISLSTPFKSASLQNTERTFEDILQSESGLNPDLQSSNNQLNRDISVAIEKNLEKEEKDILQLRLGLGNSRAHTIGEVARKYDITWQKVRNLEKKALNKLLNSTDLLSTQSS